MTVSLSFNESTASIYFMAFADKQCPPCDLAGSDYKMINDLFLFQILLTIKHSFPLSLGYRVGS